MPSLSRPMALSMPDGVSTVRGGGLPIRGCLVTVLGTMPPSLEKSTTPAISRAYPNVPDATRMGLFSWRRRRVTERSMRVSVALQRTRREFVLGIEERIAVADDG